MGNIVQYIWQIACTSTTVNGSPTYTCDTVKCSRVVHVIESKVTIVNKLGLHARAAAKFVGCASSFSSQIKAGTDGKMVDGKSIMSVMMLAAGKGTELDLHVAGDDEQAAFDALTELIANRFGEPE